MFNIVFTLIDLDFLHVSLSNVNLHSYPSLAHIEYSAFKFCLSWHQPKNQLCYVVSQIPNHVYRLEHQIWEVKTRNLAEYLFFD